MWAKISVVAAALAVVVAIAFSSSLAELGKKLSRKYLPEDPYQLAEHHQADLAIAARLKANPDDPAAWIAAAEFELEDNSPHGAAHAIDRVKALGAKAGDLGDLEAELKIVRGRWETLYRAFLANGRFEDGDNTYEEIYPILDKFRQAKAEHPLYGKARADYDLLKAHLLLKEGRRDEARMLLEDLREQTWALQPLANYLYAKTFIGEADPNEPREALQAFVARFPQDRLVPYALYEQGKLALTAQDRRSAEAFFERIIKEHPKSPQLGGAMLALNDLKLGYMPVPATTAAQTHEAPNPLFDLSAGESADLDSPKEGTATGTDPAVDAAGDGSLLPPSTQEVAAEIPADQLDPKLIPGNGPNWELYGTSFRLAKESRAIQARAASLYDATVKVETAGKPSAVWPFISPAAALGWAEALAAGGRPVAATKVADFGLKKEGKVEDRIQLARLRARLQIQAGDRQAARTGLEAIKKTIPAGFDMSLLDYEIARTWRFQGQPSRARTAYLQAAKSSDIELAADARAQAAWAATQFGNWTLALDDYKGIIRDFPDSPYADTGREHLLSQAIQDGQVDLARQYASQLADHAHKGGRQAKGRYFSLLLGGPSNDQFADYFTRYPFTVYGTYAAEKTGRGYTSLDLAPFAADLDFATLRAQERSVAGRAWLAGLWDIAEAEWESSAEHTEFEPFRAMGEVSLTAIRGIPKDTILDTQEFWDRGGQGQVAPGWTAQVLELAYPMEYMAEIEAEASRYSLPPSIVLGIIRQESYFNRKAVSTAGARGLMQLMPATAKWAAKQAGIGSVDNTRLNDPATNIRLGCWHLGFLKRAVGESFGVVLAAHNGGPGNVAKWQSRIPAAHTDEALFLELIPNQETREFAKIVLTNQAVYEYRLGQGAAEGAVF